MTQVVYGHISVADDKIYKLILEGETRKIEDWFMALLKEDIHPWQFAYSWVQTRAGPKIKVKLLDMVTVTSLHCYVDVANSSNCQSFLKL